jgi:hypothetical protein
MLVEFLQDKVAQATAHRMSLGHLLIVLGTTRKVPGSGFTIHPLHAPERLSEILDLNGAE